MQSKILVFSININIAYNIIKKNIMNKNSTVNSAIKTFITEMYGKCDLYISNRSPQLGSIILDHDTTLELHTLEDIYRYSDKTNIEYYNEIVNNTEPKIRKIDRDNISIDFLISLKNICCFKKIIMNNKVVIKIYTKKHRELNMQNIYFENTCISMIIEINDDIYECTNSHLIEKYLYRNSDDNIKFIINNNNTIKIYVQCRKNKNKNRWESKYDGANDDSYIYEEIDVIYAHKISNNYVNMDNKYLGTEYERIIIVMKKIHT